MLILVINCGSSSVKYDLYDIDGESLGLCRGVVERIGEDSSTLTYEAAGKEAVKSKVECPNHHRAIEIIKKALIDPESGVLSDVTEVKGVGHRVVQDRKSVV